MGSQMSIIGMLYIPVLLYNTISNSIIFMLLSRLYIIDRSSIRSSSSSRYSFLCRCVYYSFVRTGSYYELHDDARKKKDVIIAQPHILEVCVHPLYEKLLAT